MGGAQYTTFDGGRLTVAFSTLQKLTSMASIAMLRCALFAAARLDTYST